MFYMISSAAPHTCPASAHSLHNIFIRHTYIDRKINLIADLLKRLIQNLRLGNRPGEPIQHITVPAVRSGHPVKKNFYSKLIRHQKPLIHIFLGFHPQFRAVFNVRSENITCRNMRNSVFLRDHFGLCPFPGPRSTQHNYFHF